MMMNPVLRRETRTTLRNWKLFIMIAVYVGLATLLAGLYVWNRVFYSYGSGFQPSDIMVLYVLLTGFELGLVLLTVPALTAGSISGERERQTLDLMLVTKMSPFSIVFGKLCSCLSVIFLIILASVPVFSVVFYFGGVNLLSLLGTTGFLLSAACMIGAFGIMISTMLKKTALSMVIVYLFMGALCLGTILIWALIQSYHWTNYNEAAASWISVVCLWPNPVMGLLSLIDAQVGLDTTNSIVNAFYYVGDTSLYMGYYWIINVVGNLVLALLFLVLAAWRIKPVKGTRKPAKERKENAKSKQNGTGATA